MASKHLSSSLRFSLSSIFRFPNLNFCSSQSSSLTSIFKPPNFNFCRAISTTPEPWLMLPPALESDGNTVYNFYIPPKNKVVSYNNKRSAPITSRQTIVGSSHGWLALFNWRTSDLFLLNPITGRHVNLPPIHTVISQSSLDHGYGCVSKVIISCDDPESEECRIIMIFSDSLAFCCPSLSTEWTVIGPPPPQVYDKPRYSDDIVFSKKLLFSLTGLLAENQDLEGWDVGDLNSPKLHWLNHNDLISEENYTSWYTHVRDSLTGSFHVGSPIRYLVAAPDHQLFLVSRFLAEGPSSGNTLGHNRYPHKSIAFHVHKIDWDEDGGKMSYVEGTGLDGLAIFVGLNHSFAVSTSDYQLKPNSIYFTDSSPALPHFEYGGHDIGIFDYQSRTVSPCYYPCEHERFRKIVPGPVWFTPTQTQ